MAEDEEHLEESRLRLARFGIERHRIAKRRMQQGIGPVAEIHQISVEDLRREIENADYRRPPEPEFADGH